MAPLEEYYERNKNNKLFLIRYDSIARKNSLGKLNEIVKINPYYDITNFDEDFYQDKYITNYGYKVLVNLQNRIDPMLLDSGLRDSDIKEKIIYFSKIEIFDNIEKSFIYNESFSIEFFNQIKNIFNNFELSCFLKLISESHDYEIEELKENLSNKDFLFKIKYLITHLKGLYLSRLSFDFINEKESTIFIKALINSNFDLLLNPEVFFNFYQKYKYLLKEEIINSKTLAPFLKDENRDKYDIKTSKDLISFYKIREVYYQNNKDLENKIKSYFGITYKELQEKIKNYLEKNKKYKFLSNEDISKLSNIESLEVEFLKNIEMRYREICKKSLVYNLFVPKGKEVIDITEEDFAAIIHQVRLASYKNVAQTFKSNPEIWNHFFLENAYISGTFINQYSLGRISPNKNDIIGFNNIKSSDILDMGLKDIFSTIYYYYSNLENPLSDFRTIDDFINSTECTYNEITIKRFDDNKNAIKPDFTLAFDKISDFNEYISSYFKIPIFKIDSKKSAARMNNHNLVLLNNDKLIEYGIYLYKFYASYMYDQDIIQKYFNKNTLENILNELIKIYEVSKNPYLEKDILFIINVMKKINQGLIYTEITNDIIDTESFRKKLKK